MKKNKIKKKSLKILGDQNPFTIIKKTSVAICNSKGQKISVNTWLQKKLPLVFKSLGSYKKSKIKNLNLLEKNLTIVLVGSAEMKILNKQFRNKDYATDVLSFPALDPFSFGELVICVSTIRKQAKEHHLSSEQEFLYMLIHGILHLLGYDHETGPKPAKQMFQIQDELFDRLCKKLEAIS